LPQDRLMDLEATGPDLQAPLTRSQAARSSGP
jgi:hypothetical protein